MRGMRILFFFDRFLEKYLVESENISTFAARKNIILSQNELIEAKMKRMTMVAISIRAVQRRSWKTKSMNRRWWVVPCRLRVFETSSRRSAAPQQSQKASFRFAFGLHAFEASSRWTYRSEKPKASFRCSLAYAFIDILLQFVIELPN